MRLKWLVLFSLLILAGWTRTYAQADDPSSLEPVVLTDEQGEYPLGLHLEILEDPGGELTIEDVASSEFDSRFVPSQVEAPNYGFTNSAYWARLNLRNEARLVNRWLLEVGFANMQYADLYTSLPDGEGFAVKQTGSLRQASTRDVRYPNIVFELTLPTQGQQTYYLRFQNDASITLPLTLWSPTAFLAHTQQYLLRYGLFFGLMLGLLGYNLFLLFSLREKSYLSLTLFVVNMMFFEATYAGFLETLAFPALYSLKPLYMPLSFSLIFVWALLFCHSFLEVEDRIPRLHQAIIAILSVWGLLIVLIPFTRYLAMAILMVPWGILSLVTVVGAGIISWRRGFYPARFFMIAWLGLVVTLVTVMLVRLGVASSTPFSENAYHLGIMWMVVCWSIALADRINLLKAETEKADRDLRNSERRLAQILEGLPLGVTVYGKDQRPSFANRRVIEILGNPARGIEPDVSAGRTLAEAMQYYSFRVKDSDQEYPVERLPVYRALQGEPASADDAEADLIDRRVPLEIWASPVVDDAGEVESAVVAFQDITARRQAENALRASGRKFRAIVENNFDGIIFMGRDRKILYVSPSYEQLIGFTAQEMLGKSGAGFVHPDDRDRIAGVFAELLQQPGRRFSDEYRLVHEDGSVVWIETNAMNLLDDPHVGAVVLNSRNITERKKAEAELAEYHENLERLVEERTRELQDAQSQINTLFNTSPLGIGIAALDGTILGTNRAMQRITGYSEDELRHTKIEQLYADPEQRTQVLEQLSASGKVQGFGIKLRRRDGSLYYGSLSMSRLELAGQGALLKVIDDVSDQVEVREALTTLHDISLDLSTITDLPILLNHGLGRLYNIADFDRAALMLVEEGGESLTIHVYRSPTLPPEITVNHVPISKFPSIRAILGKRETSYVPDMLAVDSIQAELDSIETEWWAAALKASRSWLSLPLLVGERTIGLLNILHGEVNRYKEEDVVLARTFANQFAVAINNIQLQEQTRLLATESERSRIARDLHDSITQTLFSASVLAEATPRLWDKDQEIARMNMEKLSVLIRGALAEMRSLLLELRSGELRGQSLKKLLNTLVDALRARTQLAIYLTIDNDPELPQNVTQAFYRIAREALNNVAIHAEATQITISLHGEAHWAELHIQDDGRGFNPQEIPAGHLGISIMAERTAQIGGDLRIESAPGRGTEIIVTWSDKNREGGENG